MNSGIDPVQNGQAIVEGMREAKAGGAEMLFTPEMSGLLDSNRKRAAAQLLPENEDAVLASVCRAAAELGLWVHIGSLALRSDVDPDSGRLVNRGFVIDGSGTIRARYDKIHLFDVDLDTGESWRESSIYDAGDAAVIAETPLGKLGLSVCYDLRFADLYRSLSDTGAKVMAIPAAFTVPTGKAHWHVLMRARAIESAAFVVAAAQVGRHEDGRETYGHSLVVDPWGEILLDMEDEAGLGFAEIDMARVDEVRRRIPVIAHRRIFIPTEPSA
ncbi:putative amidohydrolase [Parasphingopyxis lamellibrachiae]|uniref:Putative amidohydrolase n=2 Tax=Parasphingopyxis lamellibrachiae TaxID=680125 RepID=A0A3D9FEA7_9SPHN|nr:putative amidohydrolase [Parasphingopyxis lamellibrachiae]